MIERPALHPIVRKWTLAVRRETLWFFLALTAFLLVMCLNGCASVERGRSPVTSSVPHQLRAFDPLVLRQGMSMDEVRRLEPRPHKVLTMTSQAMTVTEWIYRRPNGAATIYFANGVLESWAD